MTTTANGAHGAIGTTAKHTAQSNTDRNDPSQTDELDEALEALQAPAAAKPGGKRGRKPGSTPLSAHERLQKKLAAIEAEKLDVRRLEAEIAERSERVVGRFALDLAARDHGFQKLLLGHLRQAALSAKDRSDIAHLFVERPGT